MQRKRGPARSLRGLADNPVVCVPNDLKRVRVGCGVELHKENEAILKELDGQWSYRQTFEGMLREPNLHHYLDSVNGVVLSLGFYGNNGDVTHVRPSRYDCHMDVIDLSLANSRDTSPDVAH